MEEDWLPRVSTMGRLGAAHSWDRDASMSGNLERHRSHQKGVNLERSPGGTPQSFPEPSSTGTPFCSVPPQQPRVTPPPREGTCHPLLAPGWESCLLFQPFEEAASRLVVPSGPSLCKRDLHPTSFLVSQPPTCLSQGSPTKGLLSCVPLPVITAGPLHHPPPTPTADFLQLSPPREFSRMTRPGVGLWQADP